MMDKDAAPPPTLPPTPPTTLDEINVARATIDDQAKTIDALMKEAMDLRAKLDANVVGVEVTCPTCGTRIAPARA